MSDLPENRCMWAPNLRRGARQIPQNGEKHLPFLSRTAPVCDNARSPVFNRRCFAYLIRLPLALEESIKLYPSPRELGSGSDNANHSAHRAHFLATGLPRERELKERNRMELFAGNL